MAELKLATGHIALIDDADLPEVLAAGRWRVHLERQTVYVRRTVSHTQSQYLHTFLTGFAMTDHRNGDGLDNRRENLRLADASLNQANRIRLRGTSGYRGVTRHKCGRWQAAIKVRGQHRYLGLFSKPEEAAQAYDAAALAAWGEYARPNFPIGAAS
jgi:hypothetical protein